jgi:hypothetical protein
MSTGLVFYDEMVWAIEAAVLVDEVKDIHDKAKALELYAIQSQNAELEEKVKKIRGRAAYRAGELLVKMQKAKGSGSNQHKDRSRRTTDPRTLTDMRITKDQSSQWQRLAGISKDKFEEAISQTPTPSVAQLIDEHTEPVQKARRPLHREHDRSTWIAGRLREFRRDGHLDADPAAVIECMVEENIGELDDVLELADTVIAWLVQLSELAKKVRRAKDVDGGKRVNSHSQPEDRPAQE